MDDQAAAPAVASKKAAAPAVAELASLGFELIVVHPFGEYRKGHHIKDAAEINAVLASDNARSCNRIAVQS